MWSFCNGMAREQGTHYYVQVANNWVRTGKEDVNENVWKNANESRSICLERVPELRLKDHISCNNDPKLPFLWPFESSTYWHTSSRNKMRSAGGRIFLYLLTKLSKHWNSMLNRLVVVAAAAAGVVLFVSELCNLYFLSPALQVYAKLYSG